MKSVLAVVCTYVLMQGSEAASRFIIDDDWIIGISYPWPFDVCLKTSTYSSLAKTNNTYAYYSCSADGQTVTKYTWGPGQIDNINTQYTATSDFDCMDAADATQLDSRAAERLIAYNASKTSCNSGYFSCTGDDNYASAVFRGNTGQDCDAGFVAFQLTTSIATGVCYCSPNGGYGSIECTPTEATAYNYTDDVCTTAGNPESSVLGEAHQCSTLPDPIEAPLPTGGTLTVYVSGEMVGCVAAGQQTIATTESPTSSPTKEPTTAAPTETPTEPTGSDARMVAATPFVMIGLAFLFVVS